VGGRPIFLRLANPGAAAAKIGSKGRDQAMGHDEIAIRTRSAGKGVKAVQLLGGLAFAVGVLWAVVVGFGEWPMEGVALTVLGLLAYLGARVVAFWRS
jgi:hypothetical protein